MCRDLYFSVLFFNLKTALNLFQDLHIRFFFCFGFGWFFQFSGFRFFIYTPTSERWRIEQLENVLIAERRQQNLPIPEYFQRCRFSTIYKTLQCDIHDSGEEYREQVLLILITLTLCTSFIPWNLSFCSSFVHWIEFLEPSLSPRENRKSRKEKMITDKSLNPFLFFIMKEEKMNHLLGFFSLSIMGESLVYNRYTTWQC